MTQLENLLIKYNFPKRTTAPKTTFEEIEQQIGFTLPVDYKFFLENYEEYEEFIGPELLTLWDMDNLIETNKRTGIFDSLPFTFGIGNNPSSEFLAIEFMDGYQYHIVLSPFIDLDKQYHIEIGDSFTDFLMRLDNGNEWFR